MTRFFLLIGLLCAVWWLLRASRKIGRSRHDENSNNGKAVERMVECARCGVNQPLSESILVKGRYYCCVAHLRDVESSDR